MCSDGEDIRDNEGLTLGRDLQPNVDESTVDYSTRVYNGVGLFVCSALLW